jgi:hypothetical protein
MPASNVAMKGHIAKLVATAKGDQPTSHGHLAACQHTQGGTEIEGGGFTGGEGNQRVGESCGAVALRWRQCCA